MLISLKQFTDRSLGIFCVREGTPNQGSEKYDNMRTQRTNLLAILQFNFAIPSSGFRRLRQIANCFCHCVTHTRLAKVGRETNRVIMFTTEKKIATSSVYDCTVEDVE